MAANVVRAVTLAKANRKDHSAGVDPSVKSGHAEVRHQEDPEREEMISMGVEDSEKVVTLRKGDPGRRSERRVKTQAGFVNAEIQGIRPRIVSSGEERKEQEKDFKEEGMIAGTAAPGARNLFQKRDSNAGNPMREAVSRNPTPQGSSPMNAVGIASKSVKRENLLSNQSWIDSAKPLRIPGKEMLRQKPIPMR